jgi:hypothetical protein
MFYYRDFLKGPSKLPLLSVVSFYWENKGKGCRVFSFCDWPKSATRQRSAQSILTTAERVGNLCSNPFQFWEWSGVQFSLWILFLSHITWKSGTWFSLSLHTFSVYVIVGSCGDRASDCTRARSSSIIVNPSYAGKNCD